MWLWLNVTSCIRKMIEANFLLLTLSTLLSCQMTRHINNICNIIREPWFKVLRKTYCFENHIKWHWMKQKCMNMWIHVFTIHWYYAKKKKKIRLTKLTDYISPPNEINPSGAEAGYSHGRPSPIPSLLVYSMRCSVISGHGIAYRIHALIASFMGQAWSSPGADRTQVCPMLAPWTLLSGCMSLPFVEEGFKQP